MAVVTTPLPIMMAAIFVCATGMGTGRSRDYERNNNKRQQGQREGFHGQSSFKVLLFDVPNC
jgi:hypothetical protein